jgi:hypothetical protein
VLLLVTRPAHRDKPLDGLSADVAAGIPLVVDLCSAFAAERAAIAISLQDKRSLPFPIVRREVSVAIVCAALLAPLVEQPLIEDDLDAGEDAEDDEERYHAESWSRCYSIARSHTPNENKMSDGGPARNRFAAPASLLRSTAGMAVAMRARRDRACFHFILHNSSFSLDQRRSAVRCSD